MNTLKKLKIALMSSVGLIVLSAILGVGMVVVAYTGYGTPKVIVEGDYIEAPEQVIEEELGGSGGVFQTKWVKQGNRVTYIESGRFNNSSTTGVTASTTLVSFRNPFGITSTTAAASDPTHGLEQYALNFEGTDATSTVVSVNLDITNFASSTATIVCGGAADIWSAPTYELLRVTVPTSTTGVYNNNQATTTAGLGAIGTGSGLGALGIGAVTQILLTHDYSYFTCHATGTDVSLDSNWSTVKNGYIGGNNTFDGYWSVEIMKNLQ